jgi:hypothetical protein
MINGSHKSLHQALKNNILEVTALYPPFVTRGRVMHEQLDGHSSVFKRDWTND